MRSPPIKGPGARLAFVPEGTQGTQSVKATSYGQGGCTWKGPATNGLDGLLTRPRPLHLALA